MQKGSKVLLAATLATVVLVGAGVAWTLGAVAMTPDFTKLRSSVRIPIKLADQTKSTKVVGPKAPGWAPLKTVSNYLIAAVISSEDTSFYSHDGVDMHELREAIKRDLEEKRWARGASTITQQVVKNVYLTQEKTVTRKVREILWARRLDKALSKQEILAFYVNMVEWGPGIYGINEAARHYFGRSPSDLTPRQSAFLAMLLPSPVKYHSYFVRKQLTKFASSRVAQILNVMRSMGFIDDATYEGALHESLWGETDPEPAKPGETVPEDPIDKALEGPPPAEIVTPPNEAPSGAPASLPDSEVEGQGAEPQVEGN